MTLNTIKPLGNRVLIKRCVAKTKKGGIILPDTAKEKPKEGEVIAVGPGKCDEKGVLIAMRLRAGDHVLFSSYAGTEVDTGDQSGEYLLIAEEDILGVLISN